jgi:hypothetical protein
MRVKVVDSHPGAAVAITAQQSGLPTQRSICWRFGNASNVVAPQGAETKVVDSHREAAVVITARSNRDYRRNAPSVGALETPAMWSPPQSAETKVVDSHQEAAVVITAQQSGLPLAALHPLALWERQPSRRHRKMRKRKSLTATRSSRHFIVSGFSPKGPNPYNVRPSCIVTNHDPSLHLSTQQHQLAAACDHMSGFSPKGLLPHFQATARATRCPQANRP